ncbi:MAG: hypothetical protein VX777_05910 [Chlamydiota bacterium]|nr:hypothetical protein [Chlamydiota bacterium]
MASKQLKYCAKVLTDYGYEVEYFEESDEVPFDYYRFSIGSDLQNRNRYMIINTIPKPQNIENLEDTNATEEEREEEDNETLMQVSVVLPFMISEGSIGETARILMFFNKGLDAPGFGIDEISGHIFYRYTFLQPTGLIPRKTILGIIGTAILVIDSFSNDIEAVANGMAMKDVLEESLKNLNAE